MELWVRSQDKEILLKVNELEIETNMIIAFDGNTYQCLGTYKSKERALEILDEIQEYINNNCEFIEHKSHTNMGTYTNKIETKVYEMPEE